MPKTPKKQFIAGATCPQCQQIDTIVVYKEAGRRHRACVECGFLDKPAEQVVQWVKKGDRV